MNDLALLSPPIGHLALQEILPHGGRPPQGNCELFGCGHEWLATLREKHHHMGSRCNPPARTLLLATSGQPDSVLQSWQLRGQARTDKDLHSR